MKTKQCIRKQNFLGKGHTSDTRRLDGKGLQVFEFMVECECVSTEQLEVLFI